MGDSSSMPNGGVREVKDFSLSRFACCLVAQNGAGQQRNGG